MNLTKNGQALEVIVIDTNRIIFHVDVNSAFLSWESVNRLVIDPNAVDLRNIDAVIGGDSQSRHGIVLAKSTSAKRYGIVTGEPLSHSKTKCPDLTIVPPNFEVYNRYSQKLMNLLSEYTPIINQFSIDEAFLDMTTTCHLFGTPIEAANKLRERIAYELGFTVNIGISSNKLLAKMASDFQKPNRCHTLFLEEVPTKMWPLPVGELFFVGPSALKRFQMLGIRTIYDLAHSNLTMLKHQLGNKYAELIYNYANGIDDSNIEPEEPKNRGCGNSITLAQDVTDTEVALQVLLALSETVAARLRSSNSNCSCITVEIKYADFQTKSHQSTLADVTNSTNRIYETAKQLFLEFWNHTPIRLLGIRTSKLEENNYQQISLFTTQKDEKLNKLDCAIDNIRTKFGTDAIKRASFLKEDSASKHHLLP